MRYQFNRYLLDTETQELRCDGSLLHGEPQVLALLILLVENAASTVSKDQIYQAIWPGRIVSEAALSSRIKSLRQLVGDDGKAQTTVRTIHKKGFRFVAKVRPIMNVENSSAILLPEHSKSEHSKSDHPYDSHHSNSKPSIAVLPFVNLSNDPQQEYLSDGITSDIITHLSRHHWLNVTARNGTFGFKKKIIDLNRLGKELNVSYVIEGSVQRSGERVRISAKLIDAKSGSHRWGERYDRKITDLFDLQDEITEMIAARLEPEIGFAERNKVVLSRPANLAAWDYYHLAIHHFFRFTAADNLKAQTLLRKSIELDEYFSDAYAWWAYAVILGMVYWDTPPEKILLQQALDACNKALSLDSQNATFYALRGRVQLARREYDAALRDNKMAISLNPTFSAAHCGLGDSLAYEGRYSDAIACFEKAVALSPNDPQLWAFLTYGALAYIFNEDYEAALQWTQQASNVPNCQYWTTAHRAVALAYLERLEEAAQTARILLTENPKFSLAFAREKLFYLKDKNQISHYIKGLKLAGVS